MWVFRSETAFSIRASTAASLASTSDSVAVSDYWFLSGGHGSHAWTCCALASLCAPIDTRETPCVWFKKALGDNVRDGVAIDIGGTPAGLVAQSPDNPSAVPTDPPTSEDPFYICGDGMRHATAQETASDQGVAPASSLSARPSHLACRVRRLSRSPAHAGSLPASRVRHRMSPSLSSDRMQCLLRVDGLKAPIGTRILVKTGGDGQLGGFRPGHPKHGT